MKILMTGVLPRQCCDESDSERLYNYYFSSTFAFARAMRRAGHEVDFRTVKFGEDLKGHYDAAMIGLYAFQAYAAMAHRFQAMWAASQLPHAVILTDWHVSDLVSSICNPHDFLWRVPTSRDSEAAVQSDEIHAVIDRWRWLRCGAILPVTRWGDPEAFRRNHIQNCGQIHGWDPSPFALDAQPVVQEHLDRPGPEGRLRRWIVLALASATSTIEKNSRPSWPMIGRWEVHQPFVEEQTVLERLMPTNWGVMLPCHWSGCKVPGWYRARQVQAPARGAVLFIDKREAGPIAGAFPKVPEIESMSDSQLTDLWRAQRAKLIENLPSLDESAADLDAKFRSLLMEVKV